MAWPVDSSNSLPFEYRGYQLCVAGFVDPDLGGWNFGVFKWDGSQWINLGGPQGGFLRGQISSADVMACGSVRNFLVSLLEDAQGLIHETFTPIKPPKDDKTACAVYDLAMRDARFDAKTETFVVDPPPLSHAR